MPGGRTINDSPFTTDRQIKDATTTQDVPVNGEQVGTGVSRQGGLSCGKGRGQ